MKRRNKVLLASLLLAAPALLPVCLRAQVRQSQPIKIKAPKPAKDRFRGEVLNFTPVAITVRDRKNITLVRTFRFDPRLEKKLSNHYVENGDHVTVHYLRGSDTAVKIDGKIRRQGSPYVPVRR